MEDPEKSTHSPSGVSCCPDDPKGSEGDAAYYSRIVRTIVPAHKEMHRPQHSCHCWDPDLLIGTHAGTEGCLSQKGTGSSGVHLIRCLGVQGTCQGSLSIAERNLNEDREISCGQRTPSSQ